MAILSIMNEVSNPTGLPIVQSFTVPAGFPASQLLVVAGSAWSTTTNAQLTVQVLIGAQVVGQLLFFSNGNTTHRAFAPIFIPQGLTPGSYTLTLRELDASPTTSDQNDWFSVVLIG